MGDLTLNFDRKEFACPCCGICLINTELVKTLQDIREIVGPMHINSGYRCEKHNMEVDGVPNSAHTRGLAVDISVQNNQIRYALLCMVASRFKRYGIYKTWLHVDIDESLPQDVCWVY